ncbi:putative aldo-keto reductase [Thozetella sp. PMI_491]|nr:putative aldo-keto reductase [Thozetella sp. PMI_491]
MPLPPRKLGRNGPVVPALGLGLMGIGSTIYGTTPSDAERFAVLDRAHELGATFWDTSDMYGDCEELIGKWFKRTGKRDEIFLASKYGYIKNSPTFEVDSSGAACKKACDESLKLLGVDSMDLYYVHAVNPKTPIEDSMRAMAELKAAGKIKHIGLSNVGSADLRRAVKIAPVAAVQVEYAAFTRDIEGPTGTNLLATCRELGVAVVAYSPLGRGLLTSAFAAGQGISDGKDMREVYFPRFHQDNRDKNIQLVSQFTAMAAKKNCTTAQLAIAWLLKQGEDIVPIPGTKKIEYLEENWGALDVELTDAEDAEIRRFVENAEVGGGPVPHGIEDTFFPRTAEEAEA